MKKTHQASVFGCVAPSSVHLTLNTSAHWLQCNSIFFFKVGPVYPQLALIVDQAGLEFIDPPASAS